ncbi:MAG: MFS transporter [Desulfobacteraceae bacterium]|nr:MFS transporter [Desulfobacteraceae bacterium]MBC2755546.1 MFS transporter [Desulfobacteraceae bacterium]
METIEKIDKKIFTALFFSLFAAVTGVGIVVPLLPVYAHSLGASGFYIAMIFGGFSLTRTFFLPWFGKLSDQKGRKPFITFGLFSYFIISVAFIFFQDIKGLVLLRAIQGIASAMIMPVAQAYIGDITPKGKEGISMGMFNMSVFLGLSIGPLLGGGIKDYFSLQVAFGAMGALAFGAFCLSFFFLPPTRQERTVIRGYSPTPWGRLLRDRDIASIAFFRFVYTTCIGIIWGFLPVYGDMNFALSSSSIGILIVLGVSVSGILHLPMGALADRMDKRIFVITGGMITVVAILLVGTAEGFWGLFVANAIFGIGGGISMPALMALAVISGNKSEAMGAVMSLITVAHSMGMLCGSLFAGIIMDIFKLQYAFYLGSVIMLAGTIVFILGTGTRRGTAGKVP